MHELSIAQAIVERVEALRDQEQASGVGRVVLQIGSLSGVDSEALRLALPVVVEGTPLEHVEWDIQQVPAVVQCRACGRESEPDDIFPICMLCESADVRVIRGRELMIETVTLTEDNHHV